MATMLEKKGTCPACFGEFRCYEDGGKIVIGRHGWEEQGGRRVGEYGNAWHVGECFGVGWAPFELTPDGTWAFIEQVMFPACLRATQELARLGTRPMLVWEGTSNGKPVRWELTPESPEGREEQTTWTAAGRLETTRYEAELGRRTGRAENRVTQTHEATGRIHKAAVEWVAAELKNAPPEGPTVHMKLTGKRLPFCGSKSHGLVTTEDAAGVTCGRCLKAIETGKREREAYEAVNRDADELVEALKTRGPLTKGEIKKVLGWDTKRVNKAIDRAEWGPRLIGAERNQRIRGEYQEKGPEKFRAL